MKGGLGQQSLYAPGFQAQILDVKLNDNDQLKVNVKIPSRAGITGPDYFPYGFILESCVDCYSHTNLQSISPIATIGPGSNCDYIMNTQTPLTQFTENKFINRNPTLLTFGYETCDYDKCTIDATITFKNGILSEGDHRAYVTIYKLTQPVSKSNEVEAFAEACTIARAGNYETPINGMYIGTFEVSSDFTPGDDDGGEIIDDGGEEEDDKECINIQDVPSRFGLDTFRSHGCVVSETTDCVSLKDLKPYGKELQVFSDSWQFVIDFVLSLNPFNTEDQYIIPGSSSYGLKICDAEGLICPSGFIGEVGRFAQDMGLKSIVPNCKNAGYLAMGIIALLSILILGAAFKR